MLIAIVVVVLVVVLVAAAAVPVDRACAALAERKAGDFVSTLFDNPATVHARGRPFLPQAIRGRYEDVEIAGGGLRVGEMTGATLWARLRNAHLPLRELIGGRVTELPCEHVEGEIVLPYGELARTARIPGLELRLDGETLVASAALPVPGFSQLARVSGEAVLTLDATRTVWLRVRGISVAGINLPGIVLNQLLPALSVPIPLPELPFGLRLDELRATAGGLVVSGSADAVVFRRTDAFRPPAGSAQPDAQASRPAQPRRADATETDAARPPRPTGQHERPAP